MYASYARRIAAYLIDMTIMLLMMNLSQYILNFFVNNKLLILLYGQLIFLALLIINFCVLESSPWQASLGEKLLGIKVTDINGKRISFLRSVYKQCIAMFCTFGVIVYFFTPRRQCLHDFLASTCVIQKNSQLEDKQSHLLRIRPSIIIIGGLFFLLCLGWLYSKSMIY